MRLVLLHGFLGTPPCWDDVLQHLPPRLADSALRPPLLGHGPPHNDAAARFDEEVDRLLALLPVAPDLHLCGYSMGARVALALLCQAPGRFAAATLIGVHSGLAADDQEGRAARVTADERWARLVERRGLETFLAAWEVLPLFASQRRLPREVLDAQRARRRALRPAGLAAALRVLGLGRMPDLLPQLQSLPQPVHLLSGALDDPKFHDLGQRACARLPRGRLTIVPEAGHNLLLEAPAAVAEALIAAGAFPKVPDCATLRHPT